MQADRQLRQLSKIGVRDDTTEGRELRHRLHSSTSARSTELDHRLPSSSLQTNKGRVKVDFLTVLRGRDDHTPVYLDDLKIAAQPLRFMDYLLGGEVAKGHVIGPYALPVLLPSPGRFVLHKLVVSELRPLSARAKAHKDLLQAAWLTRALDASVPSELILAAQALPEYPGMLTRLRKALVALGKLDADAARTLRKVVG